MRVGVPVPQWEKTEQETHVKLTYFLRIGIAFLKGNTHSITHTESLSFMQKTQNLCVRADSTRLGSRDRWFVLRRKRESPLALNLHPLVTFFPLPSVPPLCIAAAGVGIALVQVNSSCPFSADNAKVSTFK